MKETFGYTTFCNEISITGGQLKAMIAAKGIGRYRAAGNWAVFTIHEPGNLSLTIT